MMPPRPWAAIVGPTASGKTELAARIAASSGYEVVSADSMLVYRGMDVGTAKPDAAARSRVPHHLIDIVDPQDPFSVAAFQKLAVVVLEQLGERGGKPLIAGGSGLYVRAMVDDLEFPSTDPEVRRGLETEAVLGGSARLYTRLQESDPAAASKIEPANVRRTVRALEVAAVTGRQFSSFAAAWNEYPVDNVRAAGIALPTEVLRERIDRRVKGMLDSCLLDEVRSLMDAGSGGWLTSSQAIGYAEMAQHLRGELSLEDAVATTRKRTKALARRQVAWFRRDPRIRWFECRDPADVTDEIAEYLDA